MRKVNRLPEKETRKKQKDPRKLLCVHRVKSHKRKDFGRLKRTQSMEKKLAQLLLWWTPSELYKEIDAIDKLNDVDIYKLAKWGRF